MFGALIADKSSCLLNSSSGTIGIRNRFKSFSKSYYCDFVESDASLQQGLSEPDFYGDCSSCYDPSSSFHLDCIVFTCLFRDVTLMELEIRYANQTFLCCMFLNFIATHGEDLAIKTILTFLPLTPISNTPTQAALSHFVSYSKRSLISYQKVEKLYEMDH